MILASAVREDLIILTWDSVVDKLGDAGHRHGKEIQEPPPTHPVLAAPSIQPFEQDPHALIEERFHRTGIAGDAIIIEVTPQLETKIPEEPLEGNNAMSLHPLREGAQLRPEFLPVRTLLQSTLSLAIDVPVELKAQKRKASS